MIELQVYQPFISRNTPQRTQTEWRNSYRYSHSTFNDFLATMENLNVNMQRRLIQWDYTLHNTISATADFQFNWSYSTTLQEIQREIEKAKLKMQKFQSELR